MPSRIDTAADRFRQMVDDALGELGPMPIGEAIDFVDAFHVDYWRALFSISEYEGWPEELVSEWMRVVSTGLRDASVISLSEWKQRRREASEAPTLDG
jgi:hypothetical protein